jgi:hypothetical protein
MGFFVFLLKISFSTYFFCPKHLENTMEILLNQSMSIKKPINRPKTRNKNYFRAQIYYFRCFQGKPTSNHNPPHHMKPFDIKIDHFDGQNLPQQQISLSKPEFDDSLSLLPTKKN